MPAPFVKLAVQLVASTIHIYNDRPSQTAAEKLVATLIKLYGPSAVKPLIAACTSITTSLKLCTRPTLSNVAVFRWICLLLEANDVALSSDDWKTLVLIVVPPPPIFLSLPITTTA